MQKSSFFFFLPHHHYFCYDTLVIPMQKSSTSDVYLCPSEKYFYVSIALTEISRGRRGNSPAIHQLFYSFSTAYLQLIYSFSTAFPQLISSLSAAFIYLRHIIHPERLSLHVHDMSLFHFVQWRRLADDGGGFRAGKSTGCSSNTSLTPSYIASLSLTTDPPVKLAI